MRLSCWSRRLRISFLQHIISHSDHNTWLHVQGTKYIPTEQLTWVQRQKSATNRKTQCWYQTQESYWFTSTWRWSLDRGANSYWVLEFRGTNDLDLCPAGSYGRGHLLYLVTNAWIHSHATRQHHGGTQVLLDAHITLHYGVERDCMDATGLQGQEEGLVEHCWTLESSSANDDHLLIGQITASIQERGVAALTFCCSKSRLILHTFSFMSTIMYW